MLAAKGSPTKDVWSYDIKVSRYNDHDKTAYLYKILFSTIVII
jgi:hypothetical protein